MLGTAITKFQQLEIGRTGLTEREAAAAGLEAFAVTTESPSRADYYPGAQSMHIKIVAERHTGRLLGVQIVGGEDAGKRIDVPATALWNGMTVQEVGGMDLSYAPPFSPVWDPCAAGCRQGDIEALSAFAVAHRVCHRTDATRQCCCKMLMKNLRSLVYASTATHALTTADLESLLADARAFNREHQVIDVLLYSGANSMQCLEGVPEDVGAAYERIKRSSQHQDIVEYMDCEVPQRTFGSWDMGLAEPAESELLALSTAEWFRATQQPSSFKSPVGLALLKMFWSMRQQAA